MILNREYFLNRTIELIKIQQDNKNQKQQNDNRLFRIKTKFPKPLRRVIFNPYNPLYSIYLQKKLTKNNDKRNWQKIPFVLTFGSGLIEYLMKNNLQFDTSKFYPETDNLVIKSFLDLQLKSLINGYSYEQTNETYKKAYDQEIFLKSAARKTNGGYSLKLSSGSVFLPLNDFMPYVFIEHYGLVDVPAHVHDYIAGKDFIDAGACFGDTSIMFAKACNPRMVYAYEPVSSTFDILNQTVCGNEMQSTITPVKKGLSDTHDFLTIHIDTENACSSSLNCLENKFLKKEKIEVETIDRECVDRNIGLIKMDIEGAEYGAIIGAEQTIRRDKPVLLISLYHTPKDFFEIPILLKKYVPEYKFRFIDINKSRLFFDKILVAYI